MHEFLTPGLQEMGEEREMLVDEEYELYQDCFPSMELYPSSHIQEAAPVPPMKELHFGTQWFCDSEPPDPQEARPMMSVYSPETQQYGYSTENVVRGVLAQNFPPSLSFPLPIPVPKS